MRPAALAICAVLALSGGAAENSVFDPSFEAPAATSPWRPSDGSSRLTTEHRHTGAQSLRLDHAGKGEAERSIHQAVQTAIPVAGVSPEKEYVFRVHVKAARVTGVGGGGKPLVVLRWRDSAGKKLAGELYDWAPYGTYDFQARTLHFQAPAGAAAIDVGFRSWWDCLTGTTWWDITTAGPAEKICPLIDRLEIYAAATSADPQP